MSDTLAALVDEISRAHGVAVERAANVVALYYDVGPALEIETVDRAQAILRVRALRRRLAGAEPDAERHRADDPGLNARHERHRQSVSGRHALSDLERPVASLPPA